MRELDDDTYSVINSYFIDIEDRKAVRKALGLKPKQVLKRGRQYELTRSDMPWIALRFGLSYQQESPRGLLNARQWTDALPYTIHDGAELKLMLAGKKPMAGRLEKPLASSGLK